MEGVFAEYRCGTTQVFRWHGVKDGFGLAVLLLVGGGASETQARDHLVSSVEQIIWRD